MYSFFIRHTQAALLIASLGLLGAGCNKEEVANDTPPETAVNFFSASQVLQATNPYETKRIYIDGYDTTGDRYVYFRYLSNRPLEYPVEAIQPGPVPAIPYMRMEAGLHSATFTNAAKFRLTDISGHLAEGSMQQFYLADSLPDAQGVATFKALLVEEERKQVDGKVRVKFVHLSPDAGKLKMYRADADGKRIFTNLPEEIGYHTASSYAEMDTSKAINGRLVFHFFQGADTLSSVLAATVPSEPGTSYVIVINGFRGTYSVKSPSGRDAAGNTLYESLFFQGTLSTYVRRSY